MRAPTQDTTTAIIAEWAIRGTPSELVMRLAARLHLIDPTPRRLELTPFNHSGVLAQLLWHGDAPWYELFDEIEIALERKGTAEVRVLLTIRRPKGGERRAFHQPGWWKALLGATPPQSTDS